MENLNEKDVQKKETQKRVHSVNIYNREKMEIVGAVEVVSSTESEIIARVCDFVMIIYGKNLRVSKLVPEEAFLSVTGEIIGVKYESKVQKKSFFGKVFK